MKRLVLILAIAIPAVAFAAYTARRLVIHKGGVTIPSTATFSVSVVAMPETTTPTAVDSEGRLYWKDDNNFYGQDGAGGEHLFGGANAPTIKSFAFAAVSSGTHYMAGFYEAPTSEKAWTNGSATQTLGVGGDDEPWGGHVFVVHKGDGATDGSTLVLTVSGTSITDEGVRVTSDSEVILADAKLATAAASGYAETTLKWLGQITITLTSDGSTFNYSGNYGFAKYDDIGNRNFTITGFECTGRAGANTTLDLQLLHHPDDGSGWTYDSSSFVPGNTAVVGLSTDHSGENGITNNKPFAYKRVSLSTAITGSGTGGFLIRIVGGANNFIDHMSCHVEMNIQ